MIRDSSRETCQCKDSLRNECRTARTNELFKPFKHCGFDARGFLRKELFPELLEAVIPECFYRESRRDWNWTPD